MDQNTEELVKWIRVAVAELNKVRSWTGRVHVQKLLYVVKELGLGSPPTDFVLYTHGPYSLELDLAFLLAEYRGELTREYPRPGYGPRYRLTPAVTSEDDPSGGAIRRVAEAFGDRGSRDLELLATCMWVQRRERIDDAEKIIERVRVLKPKFDHQDVRRGIEEANALIEKLGPTSPRGRNGK